MNITIITAHTGKLSLENELNLIKTALLYGDKVTLCSPMVAYMEEFSRLASMSTSETLTYINDLVAKAPQTDMILSQNIDKSKKIISKKGGLTKQEVIQKQRTINAARGVSKHFYAIYINSGGAQLDKLIANGQVQLRSLPNTGILSPFDELIAFVSDMIADVSTFPFFDDISGEIVAMLGEDERINPEIEMKRIKHIHLADRLFQQLPDFSKASLDEVVDIRRELNPYLLNFRSAIVNLSDSIKSSVWDKDFLKEVELLTISKIEPAIQEITEQMKTTKALRSFISQTGDLLKPLITGSIGGVGAFISQYTHLDAITLSAMGATVGIGAGAAQKIIESKTLAKKNQLFFYYGLKNNLK